MKPELSQKDLRKDLNEQLPIDLVVKDAVEDEPLLETEGNRIHTGYLNNDPDSRKEVRDALQRVEKILAAQRLKMRHVWSDFNNEESFDTYEIVPKEKNDLPS